MRPLLQMTVMLASTLWAIGRAAETATPPAAPLPIVGLAQVTVKVSDLARSRHFYRDVLGLPEAFTLKGKAGAASSVYYKVNDEQYVELVPGLKPGELIRQERIVLQSDDLALLRTRVLERGLNAGPIATGPDGNPVFRIVAPNGLPVDFVQYVPKSRQGQLRGKLLSPQRISTHLLHAGTMVRDDATRAFFQTLGLDRNALMQGPRGDYLETPSSDRNLETKNPPLNPDDPATHDQYTRELYGAVYHISLEIGDMHAARELLKQRGGYDDVRLRAAVGNNRHWLIHVFDPDGSRVELMSKDTLPDDVPSFSVMPPGPPAPPIPAKERGVYPWP